MQRLFPPEPDAMTDAQRKAAEEIVGKRGGLKGPLGLWLHVPEMARRIAPVGGYLLQEGALPARQREIAILVTARFWQSEYEWYAHAKLAKEAGVTPEIIAAIRDGKPPKLEGADQLVFEVASSLHQSHRIPEPLYRQAVASLGRTLVVELVALLGYYTLVSMGLNAFQVDLPPGEPKQFEA
jgi:4-carboxymuconolactone decarboxylase